MAIQAPIDYTVDVKNPFLEGLAAYQQGQQQRQALEAEQAQQQANFERKKAMADFAAKPDKTAEDYMRFLEANPDLAASYKDIYNMRSEEWKQADIVNAQRVHSALATGNIDAAKADLDRQIEANKNSGDMAQAESLQMIRDQIDINPKGAEVASGSFLAAIQDPEKFAENMARIDQNRREMQLQPGIIAKQEAELQKMAVDNGLSYADIKKRYKEIDKLDVETRKAILELERMKKQGDIDPKEQFDQERKLASEYQKNTQDFVKVQDAYRRIEAVEDTPAGDVALIFNYMKMLDPGSTVREGEFATAEQTTGIPGRIVNLYNKALRGKRLDPKQIKDFMSQSKGLMDAAKKREKEVRTGLEKVVNNYKLNPENVFIGRPGEQPTAAPAATVQELRQKPVDERLSMLSGVGM